MKKENAITLIALIITIIIMLILASVVISLTIGNNGIFTLAKKAVKNYTNAQDMEIDELNKFNNAILSVLDDKENTGGEAGDSSEDLIAANIENPNNYGRKVNYNVTVNSTVLDDWKLFYMDKETNDIFLVYGSYIHRDLIPENSELRTSSVANRQFSTQWFNPNDTTRPAFQSGWATNKTLFKATKYNLNSSYKGSQCVSTLLNTDNWTNFVNNSFADLAIGAPTVEMWVESWNEKDYMNIEVTADSLGYDVGKVAGYGVNLSNDDGYNDSLYFPYKERVGGESGYWIASPFTDLVNNTGNNIMIVTPDGGLGSNLWNGATYAIRPVIHLKSNMTLQWNSTTKAYNIVNK